MKPAAFLLSIGMAFVTHAAAQSRPAAEDEILDLKSYSCSRHAELVDLDDGRSDIVTVWAHGYYNGMLGVEEKSDKNWITVESFSEQLLNICDGNPEELFIAAVKQIAKDRSPKPQQ